MKQKLKYKCLQKGMTQVKVEHMFGQLYRCVLYYNVIRTAKHNFLNLFCITLLLQKHEMLEN